MYGARSLRAWLGLVVLLWLSLASLSALEYDGPTLPPGWLPISESELEDLETILGRQNETIERQAGSLTTLSETIDRQQTTISGLETSFETFATDVNSRISRLQAEIWITRGVAAVLAALTVYLAIR